MDKKRGFVLSSAFVVVTFFVYVTLTNQHGSFFESLPETFIGFFAPVDSLKPSDHAIDEADNDTGNDTMPPFRVRISDYYPRIPIHIYTHDIPSESNKSKLILFGNGFFGTRNWDGAFGGKTSAKISKILRLNILFTL
jgi:hypothetical protein